MDSKTTPNPTDLWSAMLQNATIDKAERNEFSNTARDMFKLVVNNNYNSAKEEPSDVIDFFRNIVQPFLEEVRKNSQSQAQSSTSDETAAVDGSNPMPQTITNVDAPEGEGNPVDVIDIVPPEPSSLPVASVADRYTRSMLKCLAGYPLYDPRPFSELSKEYLYHGVNVGDVGFVRGDGTFDFLFNICLPKDSLINPPNLPDGFSLGTPEHLSTRDLQPLPRNTSLFQSPITRTNSGEYICEGPEGAILELPEGAFQDEATNIGPFEELAARHGVEWYKYTMRRGRKISNGSLYLITSFTKCTQWGIAVLDRPCAPGQGSRFEKKRSIPFGKSTSKYHWKGSRAFPTKVSSLSQGDAPNQCVFLRGYKIMIRQNIFDDLCNDQRRGSDRSLSHQARNITITRQHATRIRGGGGTDLMPKTLIGGGLFSRNTRPTDDPEVILNANFDPSLVHPSDLINAALLHQNPSAKIALTHDDVWCNLLRNNFPKFNYPTFMSVARSYTNKVYEYDYVSLKRIPDSRKVLRESGHPLQGIEIPALQKNPTVSLVGEDDTILPSTIPLNLPHELVERILLLLDTKSMLKCRLVSREFNTIIQCSTLLQYFLACKAAGVIDNPKSPLSYAERLGALLRREHAWRTLKPLFETTINVNHQPSLASRYNLSGGIYFLDDNNRKDLYYCHLPSSSHDNPRWVGIPGHGPGEDWPGVLVTFAMNVYEHDLIFNVISSSVGNQANPEQHSLDLVLLKLSTGEYHPLARHPRIHIQRLSEARPSVMVRVVGDNLALVVHSNTGRLSDKLFVFDWKTGHKRLQHESNENAYLSVVFVSPEILLVPNFPLSHFEIWHLPTSSTNSPVQILSLKIPTVSPGCFLSNLHCDAEPNPFLHTMSYFPPRPFYSSPEDSIITADVRISSNLPYAAGQFEPYIFILIMHRHALLNTIRNWASPSLVEQPEYISTCLTNQVTVNEISDLEDESVRICAQSKSISSSAVPLLPSPAPSIGPPTFATSQTFLGQNSPTLPVISATDSPGSPVISSGQNTTSTSRHKFLEVKWADWGPPISRWLHVCQAQSPWTMNSTGQRYVFLDSNRNKEKYTVNVMDFNPHNRRKNEIIARVGRDGDDNGDDGNDTVGKKAEELEVLDHGGMFSEEVYMGLKGVVHQTPDEFDDLDGVLLDEERLLGLKLDDDGRIKSINVFYIG